MEKNFQEKGTEHDARGIFGINKLMEMTKVPQATVQELRERLRREVAQRGNKETLREPILLKA